MENIKLLLLVSVVAFCAGTLGTVYGNYLSTPAPTEPKVLTVTVPEKPLEAPKPAQTVKKEAPAPAAVPKPTKKHHFWNHKHHKKHVRPHKARHHKVVTAKQVVLLVDKVKKLSFHNYSKRGLFGLPSVSKQLTSCRADLHALQARVRAHPADYPGENANNYSCLVLNQG